MSSCLDVLDLTSAVMSYCSSTLDQEALQWQNKAYLQCTADWQACNRGLQFVHDECAV